MNVLQIVNEYLKTNGYDGLLNTDGECACEVDSLAPCDGSCDACEPGYKHRVVPDGYDFWMHTEKCTGDDTCEVCRRGDEVM